MTRVVRNTSGSAFAAGRTVGNCPDSDADLSQGHCQAPPHMPLAVGACGGRGPSAGAKWSLSGPSSRLGPMVNRQTWPASSLRHGPAAGPPAALIRV
jgi:hypothetical protein